MKLALTIIQVIISLGLIATVLLQSGRSAGISGAIAGGAETFFEEKGSDELLSKITTVWRFFHCNIGLVDYLISRAKVLPAANLNV